MADIDQARVDEAIAASKRVRRAWLRRPGVAAVDVGFPIRGGVLQQDAVAVRVHVERKRREENLASDEIFPDTVGGVDVDVIEAAYDATAAAESTAGRDRDSRHARVSPLMGGLSVGNPRISAGTLGAIVWDVHDGAPHILSNWHVLAGSTPAGCGGTGRTRPEPHYQALAGIEPHYQALAGIEPHYQALTGIEPHYQGVDLGEAPYHSASPGAPHLQAAAVSEPIYQPARFDGGTRADTVARLARLRLDRHMDAAVARLTGSRPYTSGIIEVAFCQDAEEARLGMRVQKSGRSTATTEGIIDGLSLSTVITYPHGDHHFDDQIHIVPPPPWPADEEGAETSEPGDSGALWVNMATGKAVGLHFGGDVMAAGESEHSLANPILKVLDALEVSFIPTLRTLDAPGRDSFRAPRVRGDVGGLVQGIIDLAAGGSGYRPGRPRPRRPTTEAQLRALRAVIDSELGRFE